MNEMSTPRPNDLDAFWMPFSATTATYQDPNAAHARARRGGFLLFDRRPGNPGRHGRPVVLSTPGMDAGKSPRRSRRQAAVMDFAPTFQLGHPIAFQAAAKPGGADAGRASIKDLFHQLRIGKCGRHGAKDRAGVSQARAAQAQPGAVDRARARLSRCGVRRDVGGRHRRRTENSSARMLPYVDHHPAHASDPEKQRVFSHGLAGARHRIWRTLWRGSLPCTATTRSRR